MAISLAKKDSIDQSLSRKLPLTPERREIRLLTLLPGQFDADIHSNLQTVSLDAATDYEALSYVWGSPEFCNPISIDGSTHLITNNLMVALKYLRLADAPRTLWIDAICIDQANTLERNHQVHLMSSIYERASRVVIFLGKPDYGSTEAMDAIAAVGRVMTGKDALARDYEIIQKAFARHYFSKILERPWWRRIWVLQELAISRHDPIVGIGDRWVQWDIFQKALWFIVEIPCDLAELPRALPNASLYYASRTSALPQQTIREQYDANRLKGQSLHQLLLNTMHCLASDPRDFILALLGMVDEDDRISLLDYQKPVDMLYRESVVHIIKKDQSLDILSYQKPRQRQDLPSWVPDFSSPVPQNSVYSLMSRRGRWPHYNVSNGRSLVLHHSDNPNVLRIEGIRLDSVSWWRFENPPDTNTELGQRYLEDLQRKAESTFESIWNEYIAPEESTKNCSSIWHDFLTGIIEWNIKEFTPEDFHNHQRPKVKGMVEELYSHPDTTSPDDHTLNTEIERLESMHSLLEMIAGALRGRVFFTTLHGLVGLGPVGMEEGDNIAILFGGRVPFIVRDQGLHQRLIGPCYVHDIMTGEAMSFHNPESEEDNDLPATTFSLL